MTNQTPTWKKTTRHLIDDTVFLLLITFYYFSLVVIKKNIFRNPVITIFRLILEGTRKYSN
ncbi:unnamed protein product, partial [Candidula unifasciata]